MGKLEVSTAPNSDYSKESEVPGSKSGFYKPKKDTADKAQRKAIERGGEAQRIVRTSRDPTTCRQSNR